MKPQKKATVAQKAPKLPSVANKRRILNDKISLDTRNDKKLKRNDKTDELKKKLEYEKKRLEKKKIIDEAKEKSDKIDNKKSLQLLKDMDKRVETTEDKKIEKILENSEDSSPDTISLSEKKKNQKTEERQKVEKQQVENKKKIDKAEDKKRIGKGEINEPEPPLNSPLPEESKIDEKMEVLVTKKKLKDEKKKDIKIIKPDSKDMKTNTPTKEKKVEKKSSDVIKKPKSAVQKKDAKPPTKKNPTKKTVVVKKTTLAKKLIDKKIKLVKTPPMKEETSSRSDGNDIINPKKKNLLDKVKSACEKKAKLAKPLKAKVAPKNGKIKSAIKKEKLKKITEKVKKTLDIKEVDKLSESKKTLKELPFTTEELKQEISDKHEDDDNSKSPEMTKSQKLPAKLKPKRAPRKPVKPSKKSPEDDDQVSPNPETQSLRNDNPVKPVPSNSKSTIENPLDIDLKIEVTGNESSTDSPPSSSDSDHDYVDASQRRKKPKKKDDDDSHENSSNDERARRMRLFGFWSGPKRHRVASLNALAKVHCLYENEAGGVYLGGFCKPKPEKDKPKKPAAKDDKDKEESSVRKEKDNRPDGADKSAPDNTSKRNLRNVPGLRGKHWDMMECTSSSSSSSEDEAGPRNERNVKRGRKKNTTRRKKNEEVMDLKDMVVCKRMASLNASAILAASYSDEKNRQTSSEETESECSEVEIIKRRKHVDNDGDKKKGRIANDEEALKTEKKVVLLNPDTDVTITGKLEFLSFFSKFIFNYDSQIITHFKNQIISIMSDFG